MLALVSRGGVFQSNLTNADVWDGTTTTDWTGSGTESDPYLISKASQLAGLRNGSTQDKYFKITRDLDMNGGKYTFTGIPYFSASLDGDGHTIGNIKAIYQPIIEVDDDGEEYIDSYDSVLFFGEIEVKNTTLSIKNINVEYYSITLNSADTGLFIININKTYSGYTGSVYVDNVHIYGNDLVISIPVSAEDDVYFGGFIGACSLAGNSSNGVAQISNCSVEDFKLQPYFSWIYADVEATVNIAGFAGRGYADFKSCYVDIDVLDKTGTGIYGTTNMNCYEFIYDVDQNAYIDDCMTNIDVSGSYDIRFADSDSGYGGDVYVRNCLLQGNKTSSQTYATYNGSSPLSVHFQNVICNSYFSGKAYFGYDPAKTRFTDCVMNKSKIGNMSYCDSSTAGGSYLTDSAIKDSSTYASWTDFNRHWIIDANINNGYPMLKCFLPVAKVTGFDGAGTSASPYLIKTHQDLLGVVSYYNDNALTQADVYWQVANDIDVSKNANNVLIHFTPICYAKEFDGYFDGNGKTISGLLIDSQYEYTGLFGTIASNHYVKDLTVKGNVYWDQAYAVGGVAGRVLAGGYLSNCNFEGAIIGVLNTKSSTETSGVVGKYEINGAIDCHATYTELKYAKIGGTTTSPTYTYYLYDWARITINLYDKVV